MRVAICKHGVYYQKIPAFYFLPPLQALLAELYELHSHSGYLYLTSPNEDETGGRVQGWERATPITYNSDAVLVIVMAQADVKVNRRLQMRLRVAILHTERNQKIPTIYF